MMPVQNYGATSLRSAASRRRVDLQFTSKPPGGVTALSSYCFRELVSWSVGFGGGSRYIGMSVERFDKLFGR